MKVTIDISKGDTNGMVLNKALREIFPKTIFIRKENPMYKERSILFAYEWLEKPYKREVEE